ncbi:nucleotidyltransferase family protein [Pseudarthrobacter sp. BRE9]|uniref:nucleotidyltransferase family protein n=1 Tax=Pseudarthrobacter sp. BRE9 TaxID=2962582 RepID=UPI00288278D2|nr:nucleotidyltransferase family protein [Pseudarthrobacter sp. BRE9]MDT0168136.1 nucleotidyltransferase family protein [Pseudarthrobacter sp. BRE9]
MTSTGRETQLRVPEGVLLGHALAARLAVSLGVRVFFIKGPASVTQGLRQAKISADVDVFVDPSRLDELLAGLHDRGWRERPSDPDNVTFPKHSVTLDHPEWPCCIDVHFRFPGMEEPAGRCFEAMWTSTVHMELAGQRLRVPTRALGILFLALHALRSPELPACRQELEYLSGLARRESQADELRELATATGSLAAVRPFLENLLAVTTAPVWPEPSQEWRNRLAAREAGSARLIAIVQASWRDKPRMVWRALFPTAEVFLSGNIYADMSFLGRLNQHRARWARFFRTVPSLVRDLRHHQ